jgi:hypothetical protein
VSDDYYVFTRKTSGERLMVVFSKGDAAKSVSLELTDTSIANAGDLRRRILRRPQCFRERVFKCNWPRRAWQFTRLSEGKYHSLA